MVFESEMRRHQRQGVLLPLRVVNGDLTGKVLYEGVTINVAAGGVYFRTYGWRDFAVGAQVEIIINVPAEMNGLLPFGGMTGQGTVVRVEDSGRYSKLSRENEGYRPSERGVAVRFDSKLRFESDIGMGVYKKTEPGQQASA